MGERPTGQRIIGGATIIAGLIVFGIESLTTIGSHGVGGDLLFATAGLFWATFGILLRHWRVSGMRAVAVVGALSLWSSRRCTRCSSAMAACCSMGWHENLLQAVVQGLFAGMLPIYLFARAVILLGAGRAATFPALVPGFSHDHRLSRARRRAEYRAARRPGDRGGRLPLRAAVTLYAACAVKRNPDNVSVSLEFGSGCPLARAMTVRAPARRICPRSAGTCS